MKIILLENVKNIGKKGDIVNVNDGYANNYLFPHKLAVLYTSKSSEILDNQKAEEKRLLEEKRQRAVEAQIKLKDITLEFTAKAAPDGRMFGTISPKQIEDKLRNEYSVEIDKRKFIDRYPVNAFGFTRLKIELFKDVIATVNVHVSEEK